MLKRISLGYRARSILLQNQYMSLGTVSEDAKPWVSTVAYAYDKENNLYFMSLPESKHCKNMLNKKEVSIAIYDSQQPFGVGTGIQIRGEGRVVPYRESLRVFKHYFGRKWPYGNLASVADFKHFFKLYKYRFYCVKPLEIWIPDPKKEYDARVRVRL